MFGFVFNFGLNAFQAKMSYTNTTTFWSKFESVIGKPTSFYIKFAMKLQNMDDPRTLNCVQDNKNFLRKLELFIASDNYKNLIPPGCDLQLYYGNFHSATHNFKLSRADIENLNSLLRLAKEKPFSFWLEPYSISFESSSAYEELRENSSSI